MPELPEVEVIRRELEPLLIEKTFAAPVLHMPSTIAYPSAEEFVSDLAGQTVKSIARRGKYLLINLARGVLAVHLRMTGNLLYTEAAEAKGPKEDRYRRVSLPFSDGSALHFSDMRRFGRLWLVGNDHELQSIVLRRIGPDILNDLCCEDFLQLLDKREQSRLKALLLDQGFTAGMGNIYTDECLFRCKIHPLRQAKTLSRDEKENLYATIRDVLAEGIAYGGTTFRDYRNSSGARGDFQSMLSVYGRKDERCSCGTPIEKATVAGRGTYYCPRCQK